MVKPQFHDYIRYVILKRSLLKVQKSIPFEI